MDNRPREESREPKAHPTVSEPGQYSMVDDRTRRP